MMMRNKIINTAMQYLNINKPLVYISGKVTGLDAVSVRSKFLNAEAQLTRLGYEVFNPTKALDADEDWQKAMMLCISILPLCDAIYLLPDWHDSKGARAERDMALLLGISTIEQ